MTPILLFQYLLAVAGGVLVIGLAGLIVALLFFGIVGTARGNKPTAVESPIYPTPSLSAVVSNEPA